MKAYLLKAEKVRSSYVDLNEHPFIKAMFMGKLVMMANIVAINFLIVKIIFSWTIN